MVDHKIEHLWGGSTMFYLLRNLKASLEQTKERLNLLNERGVEALNILYPGLNYSGMLYYQLLESLPKEIQQLEKRIKELENKEILKTKQLSQVI
jgi:hypothetical protein